MPWSLNKLNIWEQLPLYIIEQMHHEIGITIIIIITTTTTTTTIIIIIMIIIIIINQDNNK